MAEFQEVMQQWRRFCESHNHCGECEFDGKGICGDPHLTKVPFADIELRIMAWAAENPEPVYPTWFDFLVEQGIAEQDRYGQLIFHFKEAEKQIPADIAQKLGIEPKEG